MIGMLRRVLCLILTIAVMASLFSGMVVFAEELPVTFSINKTSLKAGDTLEIEWKVNTSIVDVNYASIELSATDDRRVEDTDDYMHIESYIFDMVIANGIAEGSCEIVIPEFFYGNFYLTMYYREIGGRSSETYKYNEMLMIAKSASAADLVSLTFSKPIDNWKDNDEIDVTWNYEKICDVKDAWLTCSSAEFTFDDEDWSLFSDPGTYKFKVSDVWPMTFTAAAVVEYAKSSTFPEFTAKYTLIRINQSEEPADPPTAEPTEAPTKAPTAAPTQTPSTAPAATPTPAAKPSAAPTASAPTNDPTSTGEPGIPAIPVELNLDEITIGVKQKVDTVFADAGKIVGWKSANEKIAKVDAEGNITGVKKGKTTITVTGDDGSTDTVKVTVVAKDKGVKKIKLDKKKATLKQGEKLTLKAKLNPSNAKNKKVVWESSDTSVVTVDSKGKIKATGIGNATITATASSGKVAECKITVTGAKVKKITIEGKKKMKVGESQQLLVKIKPEYAANKNLKWKSSNKKIATVDENGVVTAIKKGTVNITVTAADGSKVKKVFTITIKKK